MIQTEHFEKVEVTSALELRSWLDENHTKGESVWLVTFKKKMPDKYVSTSEVLDELLCYGWIDSIRRKLDEERTMQLIAPRKVEHWAKTYKDCPAKLIALLLFQPRSFEPTNDHLKSENYLPASMIKFKERKLYLGYGQIQLEMVESSDAILLS